MLIPTEKMALDSIGKQLAKFAGVSPEQVNVLGEIKSCLPHHSSSISLSIVKVGSYAFVVKFGKLATAPAVTMATAHVKKAVEEKKTLIPLVLVPFMGNTGAEICSAAGVSWMDLSGNVRINLPGLHVHIEGKPNGYKKTGRPPSAFAAKGSRIVRWLLLHPTEFMTQREICRATDTGEGYTSTIVRKLESDYLISRNDEGAIKPRDPGLLLDAWRESYDFSKHHIIKGSIATRTSDGLLRKLANTLTDKSVSYAVTGLPAAWLLDQFAGFRLVTFYLATMPSSDLLKEVDFREVSGSGANVWFVIPKDDGVFHGAGICEGISCVDPVQIFLDLKAQPGRSKEAAQRLRADHLNWDVSRR